MYFTQVRITLSDFAVPISIMSKYIKKVVP